MTLRNSDRAGSLPTCAVIYGRASPTLSDLARSADSLTRLLFVVLDDDAFSMKSMVALSQVAKTILVNPSNVHAIAELLRREHVDAVTTFSDAKLEITAAIAYELGLPYHSLATARTLRDKFLQREAVKARGLPSPRFSAVNSYAELAKVIDYVGFPVVLKPRRGSASVNTFVAHSMKELETLARLVDGDVGQGLSDSILEEFLQGERRHSHEWLDSYVSVECLTSNGNTHCLAVSDRLAHAPPLRESGIMLPSTLEECEAAEVKELAVAALRACDVVLGGAHVEIQITCDGPRIIEINGRPGTSVSELFRVSCGYDFLADCLRVALKQPVTPIICPTRIALRKKLIPPIQAQEVISPPNRDALQSVPGVYRVDINMSEGAPVDWKAGAYSAASSVWAAVDNIQSARELVRTVEDIHLSTARYAMNDGTAFEDLPL